MSGQSKLTSEWLTRNKIKVLKWPCKSLDLNLRSGSDYHIGFVSPFLLLNLYFVSQIGFALC